jgi:hypothetical protein
MKESLNFSNLYFRLRACKVASEILQCFRQKRKFLTAEMLSCHTWRRHCMSSETTLQAHNIKYRLEKFKVTFIIILRAMKYLFHNKLFLCTKYWHVHFKRSPRSEKRLQSCDITSGSFYKIFSNKRINKLLNIYKKSDIFGKYIIAILQSSLIWK